MRKRISLIVLAVLLLLIAAYLIFFYANTGSGPSDEAGAPTVEAGEEQTGVPGESDAGEEAAIANAELEELAGQAAEEGRAELPLQIDPITTMTRVTAEGPRVTYHHDVSAAIPDADRAAMQSRAAERNRSALCGQPEIRAYIESGLEFEYAYYGPDGEALFTTPITGCESAAAAP